MGRSAPTCTVWHMRMSEVHHYGTLRSHLMGCKVRANAGDAAAMERKGNRDSALVPPHAQHACGDAGSRHLADECLHATLLSDQTKVHITRRCAGCLRLRKSVCVAACHGARQSRSPDNAYLSAAYKTPRLLKLPISASKLE